MPPVIKWGGWGQVLPAHGTVPPVSMNWRLTRKSHYTSTFLGYYFNVWVGRNKTQLYMGLHLRCYWIAALFAIIITHQPFYGADQVDGTETYLYMGLYLLCYWIAALFAITITHQTFQWYEIGGGNGTLPVHGDNATGTKKGTAIGVNRMPYAPFYGKV